MQRADRNIRSALCIQYSHLLSTIAIPFGALRFAITHPTINFGDRLSIINYQLSIINYQLLIPFRQTQRQRQIDDRFVTIVNIDRKCAVI
jgi:hypothetical protein